jgi:hypothetical protein
MITVYFQCVFNEDSGLWTISVPGDKGSPSAGPAQGVGDTLPQAMEDWLHSLLIKSVLHQQESK